MYLNKHRRPRRTRELAERKACRVVTEEEKGLTKARQRGFLEAKGDILAYIDADCLMPPGWIQKVQEEFSNNTTLACLSGRYIYHDIPGWQKPLAFLFWYVLAVPVYLMVGYMAVGGNFAIRRSVLDKMEGF